LTGFKRSGGETIRRLFAQAPRWTPRPLDLGLEGDVFEAGYRLDRGEIVDVTRETS
jgi:hypothetical protein